MARAYNFSAGPAVLPLEVLQNAQQDLVDYHQEAIATFKELCGLNDD